MSDNRAALDAGRKLRQLIESHYCSQEEFSFDFGLDIRSVNRYINHGINKVDTIQELADFFNISFTDFFE